MRLIPLLCLLLALPTSVALAAAPTATTGGTSGVGRTAATLNATVDPGGKVTSWRFEYGTTSAYGLQSGGGDTTDGSGPEAVSIQVSGLSAGTEYHYRVVATNADGTVTGLDRSFRTAADQPSHVWRRGSAVGHPLREEGRALPGDRCSRPRASPLERTWDCTWRGRFIAVRAASCSAPNK